MNNENFNLYAHFEHQFLARPTKDLLLDHEGRAYTYADIADLSAQICNTLSDAGANPGDRISVQVDKSVECLCLYLACLRGGFVYHPLNMAYTSAELAYFLGDATPSVVICHPDRLSSIAKLANECGSKAILTLHADGSGTLADAFQSASTSVDTVTSGRDDLAALLYSSGTTGVPKGIMLSHGNLLSNTESLVDAWEFVPEDRLLHALPIFHVHGLFVAIGCTLLSGASMRWLAAFDADQVIEFLPECSVMMGVPTYYTRLLGHGGLDRNVTKSVRVFISGSAPLLQETFADFEEATGHRILERYGMTETNMNTSNPLHGKRKPGTVGPPLPGVEVRIVDDSHNILPCAEVGNLQVRGNNVFRGYWKMPDKTAEDIGKDGFFNTGDKGMIDEDGYVSIVGRAKDMVISGGLNVYPKEVESFIDSLAPVKESAVIGVPHADFGEAVVAVVVPLEDTTPEASEIIAACRDELANFKIPKRVIFVDELPRNTMAKVQKNLLRETYQGLFST